LSNSAESRYAWQQVAYEIGADLLGKLMSKEKQSSWPATHCAVQQESTPKSHAIGEVML
jgi:hypothetical protein